MKKVLLILLIAIIAACSKDADERQALAGSGFWSPIISADKSDGKVLLNLANPVPFTDYLPGCIPNEPDYFEIYYAEDSSSLKLFKKVTPDVSQVEIPALENGKIYYFSVAGCRKGCKSLFTDTIMAIPDAPKYTSLFSGQYNFHLSHVSPSYNAEFVSFISNSQINGIANLKGEDWLYIQQRSTGENKFIDNYTYDVDWSPFENKLADISTITKGFYIYPEKINIINAETKARKTLLTIDYERYNVISLCWSPDGKKLAYLSSENFAANNYYNIWTIDTASLEKARISDFEAKGFHAQGRMCWPSNGSDVYLSGYMTSKNKKEQIYKYNVPERRLVPVIESDWNDRYPAVSPNKENLAFTSDRTGKDELWVFNLVTKSLQQISGKLEGFSFDSRYSDIIWLNDAEIVLTLYQNANPVPVKIRVGEGLK